MNMNRKIIALAVSGTSAAALILGMVGPASAVEVGPGSITTAVCNGLPAQLTGIVGTLTGANTATTSSATDVATKKLALVSSITNLSSSVVSYITTVNNGGNVDAAAQVLNAANSVFADKVVAENNAMTASFEAQRANFLDGVYGSYVSGLSTGLCPSSALPVGLAGLLSPLGF
jgi:hypothetical protein